MKYDYIIAGGGLSGLSLAYRLTLSQTLQDKSILIVDRERKAKNDRTWCFWTNEKTSIFDGMLYRSWAKAGFYGDDYEEVMDLKEYRYKMIRGIDFYKYVYEVLEKNKKITWIIGDVKSVKNTEKGGCIEVKTINNGLSKYEGDWVFDGRFDVDDFQEKNGYYYQWQHFKGWVIKTEKNTFDTKMVRLMDFRTQQKKDARFFYVLPFSPTEALVEYTIFSKELLEDREYDDNLKSYIKDNLKIDNYEVKEVEKGAIPMTNYRFKRKKGKHILKIGTDAGQVKASTGYTFTRIQEDIASIVTSLEKNGHPLVRVNRPIRFNYYDTLLLHILHSDGNRIKQIFIKLFQHNKIQNIFGFLDEKTTFFMDVKIMNSVPKMPFIKAVFSTFPYLFRK